MLSESCVHILRVFSLVIRIPVSAGFPFLKLADFDLIGFEKPRASYNGTKINLVTPGSSDGMKGSSMIPMHTCFRVDLCELWLANQRPFQPTAWLRTSLGMKHRIVCNSKQYFSQMGLEYLYWAFTSWEKNYILSRHLIFKKEQKKIYKNS